MQTRRPSPANSQAESIRERFMKNLQRSRELESALLETGEDAIDCLLIDVDGNWMEHLPACEEKAYDIQSDSRA